jgi:hypothetical protein
MSGRDFEGVSDLLISCQTGTPNSYRFINSPMTKACRRSVLEKQIVRRTSRLICVRKVMGLLSRSSGYVPSLRCAAQQQDAARKPPSRP